MTVFRLEMCLSSADYDAPVALKIEATDLDQAIANHHWSGRVG